MQPIGLLMHLSYVSSKSRSMKTILTTIISSILFFSVLGQKQTEVLILGTPHLNQLKGFERSMLESTIAHLNEYEFDLIAVENMDGQLVSDLKMRNDPSYDEVVKTFANKELKLADSARAILGLTRVDAELKLHNYLNSFQSGIEKNRLEIVELAVAAGEYPTAVLNSRYLNENDRRQSKLATYFFDQLDKSAESNNEVYSIGAQLAQLKNHNRIACIDNVQDEAMLFKYFDVFIADYTQNQDKVKELMKIPFFKKDKDIQEEALAKRDFIDLYTFYNNEAFAKADYEAQWEIWFKTNFDSKTDLTRYYLWEMRNAQIAAKILKEIAFNPGERILVIIGASHRSFIENLLKDIPNVELLDFNNESNVNSNR